jgi:hypothetical protein
MKGESAIGLRGHAITEYSFELPQACRLFGNPSKTRVAFYEFGPHNVAMFGYDTE